MAAASTEAGRSTNLACITQKEGTKRGSWLRFFEELTQEVPSTGGSKHILQNYAPQATVLPLPCRCLKGGANFHSSPDPRYCTRAGAQ